VSYEVVYRRSSLSLSLSLSLSPWRSGLSVSLRNRGKREGPPRLRTEGPKRRNAETRRIMRASRCIDGYRKGILAIDLRVSDRSSIKTRPHRSSRYLSRRGRAIYRSLGIDRFGVAVSGPCSFPCYITASARGISPKRNETKRNETERRPEVREIRDEGSETRARSRERSTAARFEE